LRIGVIGFGSIGSRHARILRDFGHDVYVVSARENKDFPRLSSLAELLKFHSPEYLVIASPTSRHLEDLSELSRQRFNGLILVEKPLIHQSVPIPPLATTQVAIGYNLRFHPLTQLLKDTVNTYKHVTSAVFYAGQLLTKWRPERDYRNTSSAKRSMGGGLLRDLSHELDLASFLFGELLDFDITSNRSGLLEVDGPDSLDITATTHTCERLEIHLNYLDEPAQRTTTLIANGQTTTADFIHNIWKQDDVMTTIDVQRDDTYRAMHQALLSGDLKTCATFDDGLRIVQLIDKLEKQLDGVVQ
jgi:predicted dehydrogenase